jgi:hypothetical protein
MIFYDRGGLDTTLRSQIARSRHSSGRIPGVEIRPENRWTSYLELTMFTFLKALRKHLSRQTGARVRPRIRARVQLRVEHLEERRLLSAPEGDVYLDFQGLHDGVRDHVQIPGTTDDFSAVHADGSATGLTVAAWIKPDTLTFATTEAEGFVNWLGKGQGSGTTGQEEWTFRMYSADNTVNRHNRISFYVYNPDGRLGVGSYFQEPIDAPAEWIQVVGVVDTVNQITRIYKNGVLKHADNYNGYDGPLYNGFFENQRVETQIDQQTGQPVVIHPQHGNAPLRMGTRDLHSLLQGGLQGVRIWNRPLTTSEIASLNAFQVPRDGLVAEYPLNADTGTTVVDTTGAHSATQDGQGNGITGAIWVTSAPSPVRVLFVQQPGDTAAGQTISPAVTIEIVDQWGHVVTNDNSDTVTLSIGNNPGGGTLSGTLTVTVSGGIATFSDLSIDQVGDGYTLVAAVDGLTAAESNPFRITM